MSSSAKKRKLNNDDDNAHGNQYDDYMEMRTNQTSLTSLGRSVTPPLTTRMRRTPFKKNDEELSGDFKGNKTSQNHRPKIGGRSAVIEEQHRSKISPIQLTNIRDLPSGYNVDTVKLHDILGDPMIRECWHFNYCFDIDFVMDQFDQDVRNLVRVKIVHGSWKQDSANRIRIDEASARYPNVESIIAYMPEPFGTHHSKMMILLRHDDLAQIVIHTANMLAGDWENMSQAVWRSPLLPLTSMQDHAVTEQDAVFGSGARFKRDLLAYLEFYGKKKTGLLVEQLRKYDFREVRAALVASVPSKIKVSDADSSKSTLWGWPALKDALRKIPLRDATHESKPHIVIQVSSIASLGQSDKWLKAVFFDSLCPSDIMSPMNKTGRPKFSIVFPTPDEIRRSLNGYGSGGSIHMKLQSVAQQRQLQYMRPYLCQWAGDCEENPMKASNVGDRPANEGIHIPPKGEAGRRRAAPHIKTYIRFHDKTTMNCIDWAMITSANLSTQAWGAAPNATGEVRICSWEIGVLLWPELIVSDSPEEGQHGKVKMVPCFKKDSPDLLHSENDTQIVGFRMPYDLPLTPYDAHDLPWCATMEHPEPDWLGHVWRP